MGVCKVIISPGGVEVSFTWSDLSNKKFVGEDTSRKILDLLTRLHQANSPDATSHCQVP